MRTRLLFTCLALAVLACHAGPTGSPAGSTGQCNDGTYTNSATKTGACQGHRGVKTWFPSSPASAASSTPTKGPNAAVGPTPAPTPLPTTAAPAITSKSTASAKTPAPGGGPGLVWLNTSTKVYHCAGTKYYGETKAGKYVTEVDAKTLGGHPDAGRPCSDPETPGTEGGSKGVKDTTHTR
jgi:hypothetical protein